MHSIETRLQFQALEPSFLKGHMSTNAIYTPLNAERREIRLLHLQGSSDPHDILDCSLEVVSLDAKPRYEAISYCWGEVPGSETIRLNGVKFEAPASAVKVLRQHRPLYSFRTFWIDALCINQANTKEKSSQVAMMDQIYTNAEKCLIWLGDANETAQAVLRAIKIIVDEYYPQLNNASDGFTKNAPDNFKYNREYMVTLFTDCTARDFAAFFKRPWFNRVWVQQEAILAPAAELFWGRHEILWRDVCCAQRWLLSEWHSFEEIFGMDRFPGALGLGWVFAEEVRREMKTFPLNVLLHGTLYLEATDVRDKFYGILGLAEQPENTTEFMDWFQVDYGKPSASVFTDATLSSFIRHSQLTLLQYVDGRHFGTRESDKAFPSWVFRLDGTFKDQTRFLFNSDCFCCPLPLDLPMLAACADRPYVKLKGYKADGVSRILVEDATGSNVDELLGRMLDPGTRALAEHDRNKSASYLLDCLTTGRHTKFFASLATEECTQILAILNNTCTAVANGEVEVEVSSEMDEKLFDSLSILHTDARQVCRSRCLFLGSDGNIGLGHPSLRDDDCIAALAGSKYLCILRSYIPPQSDSEYSQEREGSTYQFIGLAYVPGLMNGEIVKAKADEEMETFEIW